jgi:preprotein translocase subunit YajC
MEYGQILYIALFIGMFYFLLIRPQQKQQKQRAQLINSIKQNDRVVTLGGIYGTIKSVGEQSLVLEIANNVEVEVLKSAVAYTINENQEKEKAE